MHHIPLDALEMYALGRESEHDVSAIEEHLLICPACREKVGELMEFGGLMRDALINVTSKLLEAHDTSEGTIRLFVRAFEDRWAATMTGTTISGGIIAQSRAEAIAGIWDTFWRMFPEHRCTEKCVGSDTQRLACS
jgi:predicted anti-sigma-YlaC factor YlaD